VSTPETDSVLVCDGVSELVRLSSLDGDIEKVEVVEDVKEGLLEIVNSVVRLPVTVGVPRVREVVTAGVADTNLEALMDWESDTDSVNDGLLDLVAVRLLDTVHSSEAVKLRETLLVREADLPSESVTVGE
jgi:hypothetical protein